MHMQSATGYNSADDDAERAHGRTCYKNAWYTAVVHMTLHIQLRSTEVAHDKNATSASSRPIA